MRFNSIVGFALGFIISANLSFAGKGLSMPPKQVQDEGSALAFEPSINFTGAGVSCVDDSANLRTTCTISGSAGAAYATVQDEGTPLTQRATINFIGSSITCVDNAGSTRTDCTLSGGGTGLTFGETQRLVFMAQ